MNQEIPTTSLQKTPNPQLLNVSNKSKKIPTKAKNKSLPSKEPSGSAKKYQTTNKKAKSELLDDIRRMVDPELVNENWCKIVLQYKPDEYKIFLKKLYSDIEASKIPTRWKKIKRTLLNMEKSDGRGGALFGNDKEKEELKRHIEDVIRNKMKTKCFKELRENVVPKIQEMLERNGRKFSRQMFQKHFWSYFLNDPKNESLKKAWKKLRRTKPQKGLGDVSFVSENVEILLENENESLVSEKDSGFLEETEGDRDEEMNKDSKYIGVAIEICELKENQGDDEQESCDLSEVESVGRFFEKDFLAQRIEKGRILDEGIFDAPFLNFDDELGGYFEKKMN